MSDEILLLCTCCMEYRPIDCFAERKRRKKEGGREYTPRESNRFMRNSWCRDCDAAAKLMRRINSATWSLGELVCMLYRDQPCTDCGVVLDHWCQYSFDHVNPDTKKHNIGTLANWHATPENWVMMEEELAGCELVCHNCHALRTKRQREEITAYCMNDAYDRLEKAGRLELWTDRPGTQTGPRRKARRPRWNSLDTPHVKTAEAAMPAQPTATVIPFASVVRHTPRATTSKTETTPTLKTASTSRSTSED